MNNYKHDCSILWKLNSGFRSVSKTDQKSDSCFRSSNKNYFLANFTIFLGNRLSVRDNARFAITDFEILLYVSFINTNTVAAQISFGVEIFRCDIAIFLQGGERIPKFFLERLGTHFGTRSERKWNVFGTQMERVWNAFGTRYGRVRNANGTRTQCYF